MWVLLLLCWATFTHAAVSIPLTVHELIPQGETGTARTNALASFGVPLKDSDGITNVSNLAILGAAQWQITATSRYPSGNLQWVLVSLLATVPAGGSASFTLSSLTSPTMTFSGLATETASWLSIDTGVAQFMLRKSGHNGLDGVTAFGVPLVVPGHLGGLELTTADGTLWSSRFDTPRITVPENGPVKAVVSVDGRFRDAAGAPGPMGYTMRYTFAKDSASVGLQVVLRNAYKAVYKQVEFRSAELVLPTVLTNARWDIGVSQGDLTGTFAPGAAVHALQGYSIKHTMLWQGSWTLYVAAFNDYFKLGNTYLDYPVDSPTMTGAQVIAGSTVLKAFSADEKNDYLTGWAALSQPSGAGVTALIQNLAAYSPAGFAMDSAGRVTVALFSRHNTKSPLVFDWSTLESRNITLDFHTTAVDNAALLTTTQIPLFGRAPFAQYRESGAFLGETRLAALPEQQQVYAANGKPGFTVPNEWRDVTRYHGFSSGGSTHQRSYVVPWLIDYTRTGHGGQMLNALEIGTFVAMQFPRYSDDFDASTQSNIFMSSYPFLKYPDGHFREVNGGNGSGGNHYEDDKEHCWVMYDLPLLWYFTGNALYKRAYEEAIEALWTRYAQSPDKDVFSRSGISGARLAAQSWAWTGQQKYLDRLSRYVISLLSTEDTPTTTGRSKTRGYLAGFVTVDAPHVSHSLFSNTYYPTILWDIIKLVPPGHVFQSPAYPGKSYTVEDVQDFLEGLAYFNVMESHTFPPGGRPTVPYEYDVTGLLTAPQTRWLYDGQLAPALGYEWTGNPEFLTRGAQMAAHVNDSPTSQVFMANSEIGQLRLLYDVTHPTETRVQEVPLTVNAQGSAYTVQWTTPPGTTSLRLKSSDRLIVPNLNFDNTTRTFQFDPATHTAWWAASNVTTEPMPLPGQVQTLTLAGLACGAQCIFSLRTSGAFPSSVLNGPGVLQLHVQ